MRGLSRAEKISRLAIRTPEIEKCGVPRVPLLLADPPWQYKHLISDNRRIENQYPTMSLEDICAYPAGKLATDDAVLFLWVPSPLLPEGLQALSAWGFNYRTCMVWVKDKIGMGWWARQQHEQLLIGTRGNPPTPPEARRPPSVIFAPRGRHSEKPERAYEIIEAMYPEWRDRRVELFARRRRDGWHAIGNELTSEADVEATRRESGHDVRLEQEATP
ncbi:MAG: MT-A70 family methyltransferase [Deltaproteobacteria bacterium]|nr:MT-A70 family methyltransferase [Deltaproteobacteria bacterium]